MTNLHRRTFLKGTLATGVVGLGLASGVLIPTRVLAAKWPKGAFSSKSVAEVLTNLYGNSATQASKAITIKAPIQAENGAVVPIAVTAKLPNVSSISILVEKNNQPLVANVNLRNAEGYFSARMKMGKTSSVHVVVNSNGKLYTAKQTIKVTVGGCGG